jgi:hypothetical protein
MKSFVEFCKGKNENKIITWSPGSRGGHVADKLPDGDHFAEVAWLFVLFEVLDVVLLAAGGGRVRRDFSRLVRRVRRLRGRRRGLVDPEAVGGGRREVVLFALEDGSASGVVLEKKCGIFFVVVAIVPLHNLH